MHAIDHIATVLLRKRKRITRHRRWSATYIHFEKECCSHSSFSECSAVHVTLIQPRMSFSTSRSLIQIFGVYQILIMIAYLYLPASRPVSSFSLVPPGSSPPLLTRDGKWNRKTNGSHPEEPPFSRCSNGYGIGDPRPVGLLKRPLGYVCGQFSSVLVLMTWRHISLSLVARRDTTD
ncbi:hypothetical protein EV363DRAFT_829713 [Boletus edulis]|nr:hypothetical protein EV363DRAFT_829713 [Boletus edulis]